MHSEYILWFHRQFEATHKVKKINVIREFQSHLFFHCYLIIYFSCVYIWCLALHYFGRFVSCHECLLTAAVFDMDRNSSYISWRHSIYYNVVNGHLPFDPDYYAAHSNLMHRFIWTAEISYICLIEMPQTRDKHAINTQFLHVFIYHHYYTVLFEKWRSMLRDRICSKLSLTSWVPGNSNLFRHRLLLFWKLQCNHIKCMTNSDRNQTKFMSKLATYKIGCTESGISFTKIVFKSWTRWLKFESQPSQVMTNSDSWRSEKSQVTDFSNHFSWFNDKHCQV